MAFFSGSNENSAKEYIYIFYEEENDTFNLYFVLSQNSRTEFLVTLLCTEKRETFNRTNFAYALATFLNNGGANNSVGIQYETLDLRWFNGKIKIYLANL